MKKLAFVALPLAACAFALAFAVKNQAAETAPSEGPQFSPDHRMLRPDRYREWIYLSSGLGMSYSAGMDMEPEFSNVFVNPGAYRSFVTTGAWPDHTALALEVRKSQSKGSINKAGRYQGALAALEVHVKDSSLPGKWAFFSFGATDKSASAIPQTADCYSCHQEHGAVDTTFVQFYPTLLEIAKAKGTVNQSY